MMKRYSNFNVSNHAEFYVQREPVFFVEISGEIDAVVRIPLMNQVAEYFTFHRFYLSVHNLLTIVGQATILGL